MADFVVGDYVVKGPKEKLDKLYKIMKEVIKGIPNPERMDADISAPLSDLESALRGVKAHPMPEEANFPMLYSPEKTRPHLELEEVESAFCERDYFYKVERTEDALKFSADMEWYDRSGEICAMFDDYDEELKVSYKCFDTGTNDDDEMFFTNDHELFPENWVVMCDTTGKYHGEPKEAIALEEFVELAEALQKIEDFTGVKIPEGMEEASEIQEWLDENVNAKEDYYCRIWRIN